MISVKTATDIAMAFREIETAENLLAEVEEVSTRHVSETKDIRDVFGRRQGGLQLGVPSGQSSHRLFDVPWSLAKPIIAAYIAAKRAQLSALNELAKTEASAA